MLNETTGELDPSLQGEMSIDGIEKKELYGELSELRAKLDKLDGYSDIVTRKRITHNLEEFPRYPFYLVKTASLLELKKVFSDIAQSKELTDEKLRELFKSYELQMETILLSRTSLAYKGQTDDVTIAFPEEIKKILADELQAAQDKQAALMDILLKYPPEQRDALIQLTLQKSAQSRIPSEGEIPEDIYLQAKTDVNDIKLLIDRAIKHLDNYLKPGQVNIYDDDDFDSGVTGKNDIWGERARQYGSKEE